MSYQALYRKWRPSEFEDVKGQEHIVTTLQNQIKADRIGHAYLFCGTRGTGKTTVAKIFAKAVNCEHPVDGSPCGECETCKAIAAGVSMNVIEIDAASNNGVDNIREIRDEVQYSPTTGKYKVYIIDEVHMLSIGAFNALLKTLEEPPSYVIFILATTEVHKIPITILSRCQRYDFRRITIETIAARLSHLMKEENIVVDDKAIRYIAKAADGSMRDALSLLDQCIAFYLGKELTYDNVLEVLGAVDTAVFGRFLRLIVANDATAAIKLLDEIIMQGRELTQFVADFTWYMRNLLLIRTSENVEDVIDVSSDNLKLLKEEAGMVDSDTLMRYIRVLSELSNSIKFSTQKRVMVEIGLIKLTRPAMENNYEDILSRLTLLEDKLEKGIVVSAESEPLSYGRTDNSVGTAGKEPVQQQTRVITEALPDELDSVAAKWNDIVRSLNDGMVAGALMNARILISPDKSGIDIAAGSLNCTNIIRAHVNDIDEAIANVTGKKVNLTIISDNDDSRTDVRLIYKEKVKMQILVEDDDDKEDLI